RHGYVTEGRGWLEHLLVRLDTRLSADYAGSNDEQEIEEIVQIMSSHPFRASALQVLNGAGALAVRVHDMGNAHRYLTLAMAMAQRTGNRVEEAYLLNGLGNLSNQVGDYNSALRYYEDSLKIKRDIVGWDESNIAGTLTSYSWTLTSVGRLADALAVEEGNLMIQRRLGDMEGVGRSLYSLSGIAWKTGDYAAAGRYGEQILAIARNLGNQEGEAHALRVLGDVAWAQGRLSESHAYLTDSLARFQGIEQQDGALDCISRLAQVAASQGQVHRAGTLAGAHVALHAAINTPQLAVDTGPASTFALLRLQNEAAWTQAWAIGQAMTLPQVIAYLLNNE
ncbi:MAG: tetratricopeptide repeat protein, partial [Chloroflexia bacterium]